MPLLPSRFRSSRSQLKPFLYSAIGKPQRDLHEVQDDTVDARIVLLVFQELKVVNSPQRQSVKNQRIIALYSTGLPRHTKVTRYLRLGGTYPGNADDTVAQVCRPASSEVPSKAC